MAKRIPTCEYPGCIEKVKTFHVRSKDDKKSSRIDDKYCSIHRHQIDLEIIADCARAAAQNRRS